MDILALTAPFIIRVNTAKTEVILAEKKSILFGNYNLWPLIYNGPSGHNCFKLYENSIGLQRAKTLKWTWDSSLSQGIAGKAVTEH